MRRKKIKTFILNLLVIIFSLSCSKNNYLILFDDFENCTTKHSTNFLNCLGYWYFYSDTKSNPKIGQSEIFPDDISKLTEKSKTIIPQNKYAYIKIVLKDGKTNNYPYAGMGCNLNNDVYGHKISMDIQSFKSIKFKCKGNNTEFRFSIESKMTPDNNEFGYNFIPTSYWTNIEIIFTNLYQNQKNTIPINKVLSYMKAIKFQAIWKNVESTNELFIDNIFFIKELN